MKNIPKFKIFNKQQLGFNWNSIEECLQFAALYIHTWNLLEWVMANIIAADNSENNNKTVEEILAYVDLSPKCKLVKEIYGHQNENPNREAIVALMDRIDKKEDSCRNLRDTIAHSHVFWIISIGAVQEQTGWLRLKRKWHNKQYKLTLEKDEEATEEWKNAILHSSNPELNKEENIIPIYTTYGESEIISELEKLMEYIRLFDYDPLSDLVLNYCYEKFGIRDRYLRYK